MKSIRHLKFNLSKYTSILILIGMLIVCSFAEKTFLSVANLTNILRQISIVTIMAFGETILIIGGQLDLSVGTNAAMSGTFACIVFIATGSLALAVLVALVLGCVVGFLNGAIVTKFNAPPFIVTLAMQQVTLGAIFLYTNGQNVYKIGDFRIIGQGTFLGIPIPILIMLFIGLITWFLLSKCKFGRYIFAIGGNEKAANASGVNVKKVKLIAYCISGTLAGLAGVVLMSRLNAGLPASGTGYETDALTATIIGGTSFTGGIGSAWGTLIGSCIIGILNNIMNLLGVQAYLQQILKGALIIIAVVIDIYTKEHKKVVRVVDDVLV
ncbi:MAG TPA: ABC transporter permease [Candidatus Pullichristensenella excrementigallinarum]|uniref:ABC transporter permease n=1 Tax=Candidatus Pullichristensenella excrementigallinarum TaxID=2840907 RepID=A0A9D1IEN0_9FIRM|nr:ABC transporter permease [Candidatus Pullichristensenella excrementigallinarum]